MKKLIPFLFLFSLACGLLAIQPGIRSVLAAPDADIYLPGVYGPQPTPVPPTSTPIPPTSTPGPSGTSDAPRINAPYFSDSDVMTNRFSEMGVFWFGKVTNDEAYTDVRIAYNDTELVVYTTTYDRIIAYNPKSNGSDLTQWDTAALALQTSESGTAGPGSNAYRFLVEVRWSEPQNSPNYQATYKGNGTGWSVTAVPFTNKFGYMGTVPGDDKEDKGWAITFHIPYSSLGVSKPASGAHWRMHLDVYNRNSQAGPALTPQVWPAGSSPSDTSHWGLLNFGIPSYSPPASKNPQTLVLRQGLNGATVTDAGVGGGATCAGPTTNYYDYWGSLNYAGRTDFNIQNQGLIADWPCYSKVYITIPIKAIPAGKLIRSAKISLSEFGGSDPTLAPSSYIQVMSVGSDWSEASLTWNNAPASQENYTGTWVDVYKGPLPPNWPTIPRYDWDVSRALADAYARGGPLRLVLYSADGGWGDGMHTGKYFVSSDTGDWNAPNRPALTVEYVDP
jgi:hypothetical protein